MSAPEAKPTPATDPPPAPVHLHPERVTDEPTSLRWILPTQLAPERARAALTPLIAAGVLTDVRLETAAVVTCLAHGRRWRADGPTVREVLSTATHALGPGVGNGSAAQDDERLAAVVREVLDGESGAYLRSHGGQAEVVEVSQGRVTLRLSGACTHCPAAGVTLDRTLEREIRRRYPALVEVRRARR